MIDPEDADYKCTLTPENLEKASRELFEDPAQRLGAVQTLRKWIREQPHITSRTDTEFMLQILRTAKFSQLRAREILETYLTLKTKLPKLMANLDSTDPAVLAYIDKGISIPLPKADREGRHITILRPGQVDLGNPRFSEENEFRASMVMNLLCKQDENTFVNGEVLVYDMTGFSAKHIARMSSDTQKDIQKLYQDCMLGRMKGFHIYNGGTFFEIILAFVRPFLKKKFLERIKVHSTMESLYELIPKELWPDEYLPDDYSGPSAGSIKSITDEIKRQVSDPAFRKRVLDVTCDKYKINLKAKPVDIPQASFRKLAID